MEQVTKRDRLLGEGVLCRWVRWVPKTMGEAAPLSGNAGVCGHTHKA